jgi:prepilin peptidase CpaA
MNPFTLQTHWPLVAISVGMIVAAVIDGWKLKVPNWLTFPLILSGWALGLFHTLNGYFGWDLQLDAGSGGILDSLLGTLLGLILLLPIYAIGGMGAGDVKMQMGFGSWVGAFFGATVGLWVILYAFCTGVIVGGVIALGMILARRQFRRNLTNTQAILGDLFKSGGIGEVADKAAQRKPSLHLLPYGIPLCIGFLGYLFYMYLQGS